MVSQLQLLHCVMSCRGHHTMRGIAVTAIALCGVVVAVGVVTLRGVAVAVVALCGVVVTAIALRGVVVVAGRVIAPCGVAVAVVVWLQWVLSCCVVSQLRLSHHVWCCSHGRHAMWCCGRGGCCCAAKRMVRVHGD